MVKQKDIDETSPAPEPHFRISVCMKHYFSDERARALLAVSGGRPVSWLHRRLRHLFGLPPAFRLLTRGHLLPPDEPLSLLERDDLVQVVPACDGREHVEHARDCVDSAEMVPEDELTSQSMAPSPSPACLTSPLKPENLIESKRRAFQLLEQYSAIEDNVQEQPLSVCVPSAGRRRRVRRRRRPALAEEVGLPDRDAPARAERLGSPAGFTGDAGPATEVCVAEAEVCGSWKVGEVCVSREVGEVCRSREVGEVVLRNASPAPARAPRVVRPLAFSV